ncbi:unnamed protein product [Phytophthora fragariaefolia]|uniref:Unnamed protein product n=1 Tax=Phytophthora fragariaefolia TaxID=1490495 RepID=A0A9W6XSY9_9STRA|nr:unnamed protein product [Phytophthora fragariaefolia]
MKYTNEGVPKNWNGKDWQTYKWAMMNVFKENKDIAVGDLTKAMLASANAEKQEEFEVKQLKIMRLIGTSVPPDVLQQIRDKETGSEMWTELCNLYEGKQNEAIQAYTIRRLENELWNVKLATGGDANLHLCKMFNLKTELRDLQHTIADNTMVDMLLKSLPDQIEFERLKSSVYYGADPSVYTPKRVRELILAASARQKEFRGKRSERNGSYGGNRGVHCRGSDQDQGEQRRASGSKETRQCYVCGSDKHLKVDCPEKTKKQGGANDELKRKPRGNCTLSQESNAPLSQNIRDQGVVVGMMTETTEAHRDFNSPHGEEEQLRDHNGISVEALPDDNDHVVMESSSGWWYFDTASNSHVTGNFSDFVSFTADTTGLRSVRGVTPSIASRIAGVRTVALTTEIDGEQVEMCIDDVFFIPGAEYGLFTPGLAYAQGFDFTYDIATRNFTVMRERRIVAVVVPYEATWGFHATGPLGAGGPPTNQHLCNDTEAEGVASLKLWHERLCHTCPQYMKTMVDKELVQGMVLTQRKDDTCDACHLGKQKRKAYKKKLDRANQGTEPSCIR